MKSSKPVRDSPKHQTTHQLSLPSKPLDSSPNISTTHFPPPLFYEPTSVLDPSLASSPAAANAATAAGGHDLFLPSTPHSDEWDPLAWLLSERDDVSPFPKLPHPPLHYPDDGSHANPFDPFELADPFDASPPSFFPDPPAVAAPSPPSDPGLAHLDLLTRAAHCIESSDFATAHSVLARLNQHLPSSSGSPLQRAAFHFKEALLSLLPLTDRPAAEPPLSAVEIVRRIGAHKAFSDLSPIPQFASFTVNQTLLEALGGGEGGGGWSISSVHLIDFEIGLGGQWSSFVQEIAARCRAARRAPPAIRVTAVVAEETGETALAAENLRDFARGLGLRLAIDFVRIGGLGALALGGVRLSAGVGEPVAVVLTPAVFRLLSGPDSAAAVLRFIRRAAPRVVTFVDTDCFTGAGAPGTASLQRCVAAGVEFYAAVLESLDAAAAKAGSGDEPVRRIERAVVRPRIFSWVGSGTSPAGPVTWRELFAGAGMAPVACSEFAESQAEWLAWRAPAEGYHVARKDGAMVLSWRGRELASTSAWRC